MNAKHASTVARRGGTVLVATAAAAVLAAGTAYAYWTTSGAGTGSAPAGTASSLTVGTAAAAGSLYPGTSVTGNVVVTNPNAFPVSLTGFTFTGTPTADKAHADVGCTTTGVTFAPSTTLPVSIPKQGGPVANTVTLAFTATMDNTSMNACQGATFTAPYTLAAQSQ